MGFFDELTKKAAETVQGAKDKTNKLSNEVKLKSKVSDKKDRISVLYVEIGKEIYSNYEKGIENNTEAITSKCKEIVSINEELGELNKQLLALKDIKICSSCGAQVQVNSEFCPKCGVKQVTVVNSVHQNAEVTDVKVSETVIVPEEVIKDVEQTSTEENKQE